MKTKSRRDVDRWDESRGRIEEGKINNSLSGIRDSKYDN
jgi:hypothetical protein